MARGMLGKSRSPPQAQGISKPSLRYTDALPRNDLENVQPGVSYSRPIHQAVKVGQQPAVSGQQDMRQTESAAPDFNSRVGAPAEAPSQHLEVDESTIGIALGSPRLLESRNVPSRPQPIPPTPPPHDERPPSALQRKSSKWRKIGGLFKAKNAIAPANQPFYQVRPVNQGSPPDSTHSMDCNPRRKAGSQNEPIQNTEVWPCLASENEALAQQESSKPKVPGSFLQVEIPQVEMERYSVMFGGLLNNNRPSLLDRRSKTLNNLTIPGKEEVS